MGFFMFRNQTFLKQLKVISIVCFVVLLYDFVACKFNKPNCVDLQLHMLAFASFFTTTIKISFEWCAFVNPSITHPT